MGSRTGLAKEVPRRTDWNETSGVWIRTIDKVPDWNDGHGYQDALSDSDKLCEKTRRVSLALFTLLLKVLFTCHLILLFLGTYLTQSKAVKTFAIG